ncbi:carboxymuconolactone decarboxylase family protein [Affinibrenneria salicis]|uniref:Carboxymuconolactone decarboxylase family protein n=1 Tax=Affinibrenneria salicis TaxID=2590031 RepID=A0A5J5FW56_9GAMM|nr:carboxymuconolactone decarboxylase family protein [Affinibrenneria salicis]KAA8998117.1 carboxymuconolactone decarboxylase family protein [Affinibrenneria salicis]
MSHQLDARRLAKAEKDSEHARAFRAFSQPWWQDGALSSRDKHIIAVSVAQVTQCEYCITHHTLAAKQLGASQNELLAAAYITAALNTLAGAEVEIGDDLQVRTRPDVLVDRALADARDAFINQQLQNPLLPLTLRVVIAAGVALAQERDATRARLHQIALRHDVDPKALTEAYAVALILRAGAVYAHTLPILAAFDAP